LTSFPAIDLFAGPGGLAEGFSRIHENGSSFDIKLSIEKDPTACQTLRLRAFVRQFAGKKLPNAYYEYIRGNASRLSELMGMPEWDEAAAHVQQWTLGEHNSSAPGYVTATRLHGTLHSAIGAAPFWVLLGGPPCQAYSVIGRSRMTGIGSAGRKNVTVEKLHKLRDERAKVFADDHRHTLYREYLRVVAVHQPPIFVMENVKGILSARTQQNGNRGFSVENLMFDSIRRDLANPWEALRSDPDHKALDHLRQGFGTTKQTYRLHSFVTEPVDLFDEPANSDFVVRSERYGLPQQRHRVIILGIRSDVSGICKPMEPSDAMVTVRDVLEGMPKLRSALSNRREMRETYGVDSPHVWCTALAGEIQPALSQIEDKALVKRISRVAQRKTISLTTGGAFVAASLGRGKGGKALLDWLEDDELGGVIQHESRSHMASDLARYLYLSSSTNYGRSSPALEYWPKTLLPKHANIREVRGRRIIEGFSDRFRVQIWDRPSSTVTSHIHKDGHYFIHPDPEQCRSLTVREAARLQTFPDNYFFEGNRSQQFIQVGNAVPPFLAFQLARRVAQLLSGAKLTNGKAPVGVSGKLSTPSSGRNKPSESYRKVR
jgi:DNA (cytosine-5)-methyltransferase 1